MLSEMTLRGVEGIRRVFMREPKLDGIDPVTGAAIRYHEWLLDTEGVNLHAVMCADRRVDETRTTSNDIVEIIRVLGVEAVRQVTLTLTLTLTLALTLALALALTLTPGAARRAALRHRVRRQLCQLPPPGYAVRRDDLPWPHPRRHATRHQPRRVGRAHALLLRGDRGHPDGGLRLLRVRPRARREREHHARPARAARHRPLLALPQPGAARAGAAQRGRDSRRARRPRHACHTDAHAVWWRVAHAPLRDARPDVPGRAARNVLARPRRLAFLGRRLVTHARRQRRAVLAWVQPELTELLTHLALVQPDVALVQPNQPVVQPDEPVVQPDEPELQPDEPELQPDEPELQPDQPELLTDFAQLLAHLAFLQPDQPELLAHEPELQPDLTELQPNEPELQPDQPQLLTHLAFLLSHESKLFAHLTILQPNEPIVFAHEPELQPGQPELLTHVALVQPHRRMTGKQQHIGSTRLLMTSALVAVGSQSVSTALSRVRISASVLVDA